MLSVECSIIDTGDFCAERVESGFDVLVAAVDLRDVGDAARAVGRHSGDEQGDSGADVGTCHSATAKLDFSVVADDDGAMRVAKDDLCAHIDEFIDEKQATLEHFLVEWITLKYICYARCAGAERPQARFIFITQRFFNVNTIFCENRSTDLKAPFFFDYLRFSFKCSVSIFQKSRI